MDENLRHQRDTSLGQLEALIRRGREIRNARSVDATRAWQHDCAAAINQLSGGSKAHWLAQAYSGAFMVRSEDGGVVVEADATEIVDRILDVLAQGASSLSRMDDVEAASSGAAPHPRRFEFVHNARLRPVLEQAFVDGGRALKDGDFQLAFMTSCGVLEAIITDALEHARHSGVAELSFDQRITAAEKRGLIRGGCARLPSIARTYRAAAESDGPVSERDAKVVRQVLHIVIRDLDPGR